MKIFAEDEWGGHGGLVCYFVQPLRAGRVLDSPRHAARFVSLIPYTKIEAVGAGAGRAEIWHTFHTFLSMRKGDCEDHGFAPFITAWFWSRCVRVHRDCD